MEELSKTFYDSGSVTDLINSSKQLNVKKALNELAQDPDVPLRILTKLKKKFEEESMSKRAKQEAMKGVIDRL